MTMMSIESIELDAVSNKGSVFVDKDAIEKEYLAQIAKFDSEYLASSLRNDHKAIAPGITELDRGAPGTQGTQTGFCYQFGLLSRRNFLNLLRLPQTSYVKFVTTCLTALFAILLFYNTD